MNTFSRDMKYVFAAAVLGTSILLTAFGVPWGVNISLAYLGFNACAFMFVSGFMHNPDLFNTLISTKRIYRNSTLQFMVNIMTGLAIYQMYIADMIFASGFFTFLVASSTISNGYTLFAPKGPKDK